MNLILILAALLLAPLAVLNAADQAAADAGKVSLAPGEGRLAVTGLRCEYLVDPPGIDVAKPRLSWKIEVRDQKSAVRGLKQTAYQVLVASTPGLLAKDQGDLWDSGKVASDQSIQVEYAGKPLESRMQCHWKVRVWTLTSLGSGPLDMNNGLADLTQAGRVDQASPVPSTQAGEAARTLIVFSGTTIIPDIPENYRKHPELLQFLAAQRMPWRESKTLSGAIGEHIVMARQAADGTWLVGVATNEDPRELAIPLDFLPDGPHQALVIEDGEDSDYRTHRESSKASRHDVTKADTLRVKLAPGGGTCVILRKTAQP